VFAAQLLPLSFAAQAQIPVAILLVLLLGAAIPDYPYWRVIDAALGGAVGIAVGLLIPERPHVAPAQQACATWAEGIAELLRSMSDEVLLRAPLPSDAAHAFVLKSRALYQTAADGQAAVAHAAESVAFNPRARHAREQVVELRGIERWLVRLTLEARVLAVTVDQMYDRPDRSPRLQREDLSRLLAELAVLLRERAAGTDVSVASDALALDLAATAEKVAATPKMDRIPMASISLVGRLDQVRLEIADPALGPALT
jgi:hypothetical protein